FPPARRRSPHRRTPSRFGPTSGCRVSLLRRAGQGQGHGHLPGPGLRTGGGPPMSADEPAAAVGTAEVPRSRAPSMSEFYDRMASLYHLIFQDWNASIERQAGQLTAIIHERWGPGCRTVLDVSCGIGTQALGLAQRGFAVTASDLSAG